MKLQANAIDKMIVKHQKHQSNSIQYKNKLINQFLKKNQNIQSIYFHQLQTYSIQKKFQKKISKNDLSNKK